MSKRIRDRSEIAKRLRSHPATESGAATGTASKRIQLIKCPIRSMKMSALPPHENDHVIHRIPAGTRPST
jgi:hypothetical protein